MSAGMARPFIAEQPVVLERLVEVGLAVEDRDGDVATAGEQGLELVGVVDGRSTVKPASRSSVATGVASCGGRAMAIAGSGHDQPSASGSRAATVSSPSASAVTRAPKPGSVGDDVAQGDGRTRG